jgi:hypothetical protein
MAINKLDTSFLETQKFIKETVKHQEVDSIKSPILQRCAEKSAETDIDPKKGVHQAYDRMHHRHNRS